MDKPATDPALLDELWEKAEKQDRKERKAPREQWIRVHSDPATDATASDPGVGYTIHCGDGLFRKKFIELIEALGTALGANSSPEAAFNQGMRRVFDDASNDKNEFLQYQEQFYMPSGTAEIQLSEDEDQKFPERFAAMTEDEQKKFRDEFRIKGVGVLTRVFRAVAISCWHLKREALAAQTLPPLPDVYQPPFRLPKRLVRFSEHTEFLPPPKSPPPEWPPYVYQEYPKWKYHAAEKARIVENEAEEQALGSGWYDSPAQVLVALAEPTAAMRRALWDEYRKEVRKKKKVIITQDQMAIEAGYKDRSEFAKWLSVDPIPNRSAHQRFMDLLTKEKPHLK